MKLVISCEHGGNDIPKDFQKYFLNQQSLLESHRGYDAGTLDLFKKLVPIADFSESNTVSRLLIECNRSLHHPKLFSEISKKLPDSERKYLIEYVYLPYRNAIEFQIRSYIAAREQVLHISLHSFTPCLNKVERNNDIGLLYDSRKLLEKAFCEFWKNLIWEENSLLKVRYNYPYLGSADGFATYLRKQFPEYYIGIELEVNQKWVKNNAFDESIKTSLINSINRLYSKN